MSSQKLPQNFGRVVPEDDTHERDVCKTCGFVDYKNPKVIVGSVVHHDGKILLCRRAIEPRSGYWTLPAGFLELGESAAEGAMREAREEVCADIVIEAVLAVYTIERAGQLHVMHVARLASPHFQPGPESSDVKLFSWEDIPWEDLAFPSVHWSLHHFRAIQGKTEFAAFTRPWGDRSDTS